MVEAIKFVYVMVIFISLFLVAMNVDAFIKCTQDSDCPKSRCSSDTKAKCYAFKTLLFPDSFCICDGEMSLDLIS
ncbi:unnamed protein product [Trifolium pratense]|uniref:Uncharacterized protein n=1 Tax=Trifolium pratense TaxID=57577 RepID=A0ACB0KM75_TRIPR|nr:unnamed protein product [Trifolium pratense]